MKSDKHFYVLFEAWPEALKKLIHIRENEYRFSSKTLKEMERRVDGWLESVDDAGPRYVIEFEMWSNPRVYHMVIQAMASVYLDDLSRPVFGRILFRTRSLDLKTKPWRLMAEAEDEAFQVHYLDEELAELERLQPGHPLISVLRPMVIQNWSELEKYTARDYHCIRAAELPTPLKKRLSDLFLDWIVQIYHRSNPGKELEMLDFATPVEETRVYRDLIERFRREFEDQGVEIGKILGEIQMLTRLYQSGNLSQELYDSLVSEAQRKLDQLTDTKAKRDSTLDEH